MAHGDDPLVPLPGTGTLRLERTSWRKGLYEVRTGRQVVAKMDYTLAGSAVVETASGSWHLVHRVETLGVEVRVAGTGERVAALDFVDWSAGGTARLGDLAYDVTVAGVVHPQWCVRREGAELFTLVRSHLLSGDADIALTDAGGADPHLAMLVLLTVHAMITQQKDAGRS